MARRLQADLARPGTSWTNGVTIYLAQKSALRVISLARNTRDISRVQYAETVTQRATVETQRKARRADNPRD
jgi:hypothetical protein